MLDFLTLLTKLSKLQTLHVQIYTMETKDLNALFIPLGSALWPRMQKLTIDKYTYHKIQGGKFFKYIMYNPEVMPHLRYLSTQLMYKPDKIGGILRKRKTGLKFHNDTIKLQPDEYKQLIKACP